MWKQCAAAAAACVATGNTGSRGGVTSGEEFGVERLRLLSESIPIMRSMEKASSVRPLFGVLTTVSFVDETARREDDARREGSKVAAAGRSSTVQFMMATIHSRVARL